MEQQRKTLVVVLGMHRSGTSAITRGLQVLGVELGNRLMAPTLGVNDKGFFEDLDVNALNDALLKAIDRIWHTLTPISASELFDEKNAHFTQQAIVLLGERLRECPCFGLKDPRIALLLPFWLKVFEMLGLNVVYVIALRNPLAVASSLEKCHRFPPEKSHWLWLQHVVPSVLLTRGARRVVVDYDRLIDQPDAQVARLGAALGLARQLDPALLTEYREDFLEEQLRHARFGQDEMVADPRVPDPVKRAYRLLLEVAADRLDLEAPALRQGFDELSDLLQDVAPIMRYLQRGEGLPEEFERKAHPGEEVLAAQKAQMDRFALALAERAEQIENLRQDLGERDRQLAVQAEQARLRDELLQRWSIAE